MRKMVYRRKHCFRGRQCRLPHALWTSHKNAAGCGVIFSGAGEMACGTLIIQSPNIKADETLKEIILSGRRWIPPISKRSPKGPDIDFCPERKLYPSPTSLT